MLVYATTLQAESAKWQSHIFHFQTGIHFQHPTAKDNNRTGNWVVMNELPKKTNRKGKTKRPKNEGLCVSLKLLVLAFLQSWVVLFCFLYILWTGRIVWGDRKGTTNLSPEKQRPKKNRAQTAFSTLMNQQLPTWNRLEQREKHSLLFLLSLSLSWLNTNETGLIN